MLIKDLRKLAELNLCSECYEIYKALLEPNIKSWLLNPLNDWSDVESYITGMVMKLKGVFKDDSVFILFDKDDLRGNLAHKINVKAFQEIEQNLKGFKRKIDYLRKHEILQKSSYGFLNKMREIRNRIHPCARANKFNEQDIALFSFAKVITSQIFFATMFNLREDISANMKSNAENLAQQLLSKMSGQM